MESKDKILEETDLLFADRGYNLSMSDIAKQVGIKVPSIYSHYSGKDEIILIVVEREINRFYSLVLEEIKNMNGISCEEKLKKLYYLVLNYYKQESRLRFWKSISLIQNQELKKQCGDLIRDKESQVSEALNQIFLEGIKKFGENADRTQGMVSFYFVLLKGVVDMLLIYEKQETDLEAFFDTVWNEYWRSIKNQCDG